uniref:THAP-type domain-containing protein n=1 Tax=Daphnia galeata TaxID=27404 RepID=A0A8J2WM16_9CRUS|nr:unnamed protein product [Daphnia galeata]
MKHCICVIPGCKTSPISDPNVKFISFPRNELKRKLWFDTLGFLSSKIPKTRRMHVCEKHFELETDLKDYEKFKSGVGYLKLKDGVVPHLNLPTSTSCEVDYEAMNFSANNYDIELEGRMSVASMSSGYHSLYSESRMSTTTECNVELHQILGDVSEPNHTVNDCYHLEPMECPTPISSTEETQKVEDLFVNSSDIDLQGRISVDSHSSGYYSSQCESRMSTTTECNMALHDILGDACEHNHTCFNNYYRHEQMETSTPIVVNKETQTDHKQFVQSLSIKETQNETVSKKSHVRSKAVQHNLITWAQKDAACSPCWKVMPLFATSPVLKLRSSQSSTVNPWDVTAQDDNSPSPIKCTSPQQSWQISSTPLSAKRKLIVSLSKIEMSSYDNVRKKRKCARSLSYEETSSNKGDTSP